MGENSPPAVDTGVLQTIGINAGAQRDVEADDLALAKAMQEQERAFHWLASHAQQDAVHAATPERAEPPQPQQQQQQQPQQQQAQPSGELSDAGEENTSPQPPGTAAAAAAAQQAGGGAEWGHSGASAAAAVAPEGLTDEEYALMLQQEEQQAHLLELAGYGGEEEGEYDEEGEGGYMSDDSVDPDDMTYEELQALGEAVGTVSRGLPPSVVASLPRKQYSAPRRASAQEEQCAVCREEYQEGEEVASLPCSHFYHPACIAQWLQHQKVCPICSQELKAA